MKLAKLTLLEREQLGKNDIKVLPWTEVLKELNKTDKGEEYIEVKHPDNKGIVKEIIKLSK